MLCLPQFRRCALLISSLLCLPSLVLADTYTGQIVGPDERPVPGAQIMMQVWGIRSESPLPTPAKAIADAEGRFTLEYSRPAPTNTAKDEIVPANGNIENLSVIAVAPEGVPFAPGAAVIQPGAQNTIELSRADVYAGTLRDELGRPLTNVRLSIRFLHLAQSNDERTRFINVPAEIAEMLSTRTDAKGAFRIERVPKGSSASIAVDDPLLVLQDSYMAQRVGEPVTLRAHRGGTLSGRVVDTQGEPVQGASVTASWSDETSREARQRGGNARTGADGSFRIASLVPGTYTLAMSGYSEKSLVAHLVHDVPVEAGKDNPAPEILAIEPTWLTGTVINARTQEPMVGAAVTVSKTVTSPAFMGTTDTGGKFKIPLVPGRLEVTAQAPSQFWNEMRPPGSVPITVEVGDGATRSVGELRVEPGEVLRGRMVDEKGVPLPGKRIVVGSQIGGGVYVTGDTEGRFSLEGIKAGMLHINNSSLGSDEWKVISPKTVTVPAQEEVVVKLGRVQQVMAKGRVLTAEGHPVADARVRFKHEFTPDNPATGSTGRAWSQQTLRSEADGTILFKGLKPDSVLTLEKAEKEGYLFVSGGGVTKRGNEYLIADIVLRPLSKQLQGVVTDAVGKPVADVLVWSPLLKPRVRSSATGEFTLSAADTEIELWAAKGRAAGHTKVGGKTLTLSLRESEAVSERDLARALPLLREVESDVDATAAAEIVAALAPIDPGMALKFAPSLHKTIAEVHRRRGAWPREDEDGARRAVIQAWSRRHSEATAEEARDVLAMLDEIESGPDFIAAASSLGIALAKDDVAKSLLERAVARLDPAPELNPTNAPSGAVSAAQVAALAATLGSGEADEYFNLAVAVHAQQPTLPDLMGQALAQGPADLVRRFAEQLPPDVRPSLMNGMPTSTRLIFLNYAIPVLAPRDPEAAYELLLEAWDLHEQAFEGKARNFNEGWIADATRAVIKAYGPQRPDLMPDLARWVRDPWHQVPMLALGAEYSKPEDARQLLAEAAGEASKPHGMRTGLATLARVAAAARKTDPALANEMMQGLLAVRAEDERRLPTNEGEIAYYLSFVSPEEARALLETEWARERAVQERRSKSGAASPSTESYREDSSLALGMAPLDWERAIAWARDLEPGAQQRTLARLALWALKTHEERTLFQSDQAP